MKQLLLFISVISIAISSFSQATPKQVALTPELLWKLGRVSGLGLSKDGKHVLYDVGTPNVTHNRIEHVVFSVALNGGAAIQVLNQDSILRDKNISADGK